MDNKVCIMDQQLKGDKHYQIMRRDRYGFAHVFPGKLFTLEEAQAECEKTDLKSQQQATFGNVVNNKLIKKEKNKRWKAL